MSIEEEAELRDLLAQTLDLNGCLPKIRAQLRANLFLALNEDSKVSQQQILLNKKIKSQLEAPEGQLMFCLVREFLEYYDLDFTISVYEPESYGGSGYKYEGRKKLVEDLGLRNDEESLCGPLLLQLLKVAQSKSNTLKINLSNISRGNPDSSNSVCSTSEESHVSQVEDVSVENKSDHSQEEVISEHILKNVPDTQNLEVPNNPFLETTYIKTFDDDELRNGTSSIEEVVNSSDSSGIHQTSTNHDQEGSPDSTSKQDEKIKLSQKEKLKSKLDLPSLQMHKRGSDILPSLYNKEFKEKTVKDFDFDIKDDYAEDFMSGSEGDFSLSNVDFPKPLLEELREGSSEVMESLKGKVFINLQSSHSNKNSHVNVRSSSNSTTEDIETIMSEDAVSNKSTSK